jgi:hypothetical protein
MSPQKCGHLTRNGDPCQAWAVRGSSPPRCAAHGGRPLPPPAASGGRGDPTWPVGEGDDTGVIAGIIGDLAAKQQRLSAYIDDLLSLAADRPDGASIRDIAHLLALHSQNAARLGRLLRDKRALSGEAADGIAGAIAQALDELGSEWGLEL